MKDIDVTGKTVKVFVEVTESLSVLNVIELQSDGTFKNYRHGHDKLEACKAEYDNMTEIRAKELMYYEVPKE